jgi:hypothetical protein
MTDMHLILSDILLPKDIAVSWLHGLSLPGLETLMQRSGRDQNEIPAAPEFQRTTPDIRALLRHYSYPVSPDQAALAPLLMLADGLSPGKQVWHVLSPAHYALARDHVVLGQTALNWEQEQDWQELAQIAGTILTTEDGQFIAKHPERWYWQHPHAEDLLSSLPHRALGRNVDIWMPSGNEQAARFWRRLHNELQMSWHEHSINQRREQQGLAVANGVWLYGSGALPATDSGSLSMSVNACLPAIQRGLQHWSGLRDVDLIDNLSRPYAQQDVQAWRSTLEQLDLHLFQPLVQRHDLLKISLCGEHAYREYAVARPGSWWRRFRCWRPPCLANWLSV